MKNKPIKRIAKTVFILASIGSLYFVPWILVKAWILPLPDTVQEQAKQAIDHGFDGIIVHVDQAGKPPEYYTAGWHDKANKIPARPNALFKIASISKLYAAVAVTKLVKDNRLSLDKTLAEYFPELVGRIENAEEITLRLMVQHRSGIPNFTDNPDFWIDEQENGKKALDFALDLPANFAPDKGYGYSNTNYLLIRRLIDRVVGYGHYQYIKEEILVPLQLNHTYGSLKEVNLDNVMSGYYVGIDKDFKTNENGMLATAADVATFLRALNDGSVFDEGEQEIYSSIYVYEHTGLVPGYQSIAKYHKDTDTVVIQFTSTTNFQGYNWNLSEIIYNRIIKILRRQEGSKEVKSEYIESNSGLKYKTLKEGVGPMAENGDEVLIFETTSYRNGTKLYSNEGAASPLKIKLGANMVTKGVEEGLHGMRSGEIRELVVPHYLAKRTFYPENVSPDSTLVIKLIVEQVIKAK